MFLVSFPSFLHQMSAPYFLRCSCVRGQPCLQSLLSVAIFSALIASAWRTGMAQENTDPEELQALYEVLAGVNSKVDWNAHLPDPCSGYQLGVYCLEDEISGMYHVTNLEFGFVSEYDSLVTCSSNAILHPSIGLLPFLQTLFIYNCFVNGSATIPKEIGQLSRSLQMLTLHGNPKLGGVLPAEMGNLTSLQRLVVTENSIGGMLPEELGNLHSLLQLDFSENQLNGSVPDFLNSLQSLVILNLGYNFFSGELPPLGDLTRLQELVLSTNNLSGSIPEDYGDLSSLTYLDLSRNNLSGGIPSSFANLTKLEDMFIENNSMQSSMPEFVGEMTGLLRLSLSDAGFLGEIPQSLGDLVNLRSLLLQGNNFSGHIPVTLGGLPNIYQLDLSNNQLSGPVPFSPAFVAKMGTNLLVSQNTGLCIPRATTLKEAVAALGVSTCDQANSLDNSGLDAPALGQQQLPYSDASRHVQKKSYVCLLIAFAAWIFSVRAFEFYRD